MMQRGESGTASLARPLDWTNIAFVGSAHLLALAAILWVALVRASPWSAGLGVLWFVLCGLALTGGYHRLFAHPTYRTNRLVRAFYLVFGAAAFQNSALKWAADHRRHHAKVDLEEDPYNINRGFLWAHMVWVFFADPEPGVVRGVKDLEADSMLRWQHRNYKWLGAVVGFILPGALGLLWGDPVGAFLVGGFLRLVAQWHATGAVNSLAHCIGRQPYSREATARDSHWLALFTLGEGYHNFHHRFQLDYRNGVRWFHFDPTKWFVRTLEGLGLATGLRRTPAAAIEHARAVVRSSSRDSRSRRPGRRLDA